MNKVNYDYQKIVYLLSIPVILFLSFKIDVFIGLLFIFLEAFMFLRFIKLRKDGLENSRKFKKIVFFIIIGIILLLIVNAYVDFRPEDSYDLYYNPYQVDPIYFKKTLYDYENKINFIYIFIIRFVLEIFRK